MQATLCLMPRLQPPHGHFQKRHGRGSPWGIRSGSLPYRSHAFQLACKAANPAVEEGLEVRTLTPEEEGHWKAALEQLVALGFDEAEAEAKLQKGFGWVHSAYWRQDKVQQVPQDGQVEAVIAYLTGLGLSAADLQNVLAKFPEALGCSVEERLQANIAKLEKEWKIKGPAVAGVLKRQPRVLGYSVDCLGDCIGECDRCWVRF